MERLHKLIGREKDLDDVSRELKHFARETGAPVIGGVQVTCSDECERENVESFQRCFVDELLPDLKFWKRSPFRLANLGARYEPGALSIAENHFDTEPAVKDFKLVVVKINSHVSMVETSDGLIFGHMNRYGCESTCCGALIALLSGSQAPFARELQAAFAAGGKDRLGTILDPMRVDPSHRVLFAAIVNSILQGQSAVADIRVSVPSSPTVFLIASCVTINKPNLDGELLCGLHSVECLTSSPHVAYHGLTADPSRYRFSMEHRRLRIDDTDVVVPGAQSP